MTLFAEDETINMLRSHSLPFRAERWFTFFLFAHLLAWTILPAVIRDNLPLDAIEGATWGHQLEWGYDKDPYLNGWLTSLATYLGGYSGWMIYLFSQLSIVAAFWVVFQLAKKMLSPAYALLSVLLLEATQYYNFHAIDFNDNTLEIGLWAFTIYFFYKALQNTRPYRDWILTGLFAGLSMMAKYYAACLLLPLFLFLLSSPKNRAHLKTLAPYLGAFVFLIVITPHLLWLTQHDFITVQYVAKRTAAHPHWTNRFFFPLQFAWQQFEVFLPGILLFSIALIGSGPVIATSKTPLTSFDKRFLIYAGLGPLLLTMLLSLLFSIKLRGGWGTPLLSLWGILLVALIQPAITLPKLYRFIGMTFLMMLIMLASYTVSLLDSADSSTANFPGKDIARYLTQEWQSKYHTKLSYVAGSRWVCGNIEYYSPDHPAVFIEWNTARAPWVQLDALRKKGGIFIWEMTRDETLPNEIKRQFPTLTNASILEFDWQHNTNHLAPVKIGVAYLPPENKRRIAAIARSISSTVVKRPNDTRTELLISASVKPIARKT